MITNLTDIKPVILYVSTKQQRNDVSCKTNPVTTEDAQYFFQSINSSCFELVERNKQRKINSGMPSQIARTPYFLSRYFVDVVWTVKEERVYSASIRFFYVCLWKAEFTFQEIFGRIHIPRNIRQNSHSQKDSNQMKCHGNIVAFCDRCSTFCPISVWVFEQWFFLIWLIHMKWCFYSATREWC